MKNPRTIEANLVSFGVALGSLLVVLVLALLGVEHALGTRLERLGSATMPAQQAVTGLRHAVSRLFERQVQVLSTRSEAELDTLKDRKGIEHALGESRQSLAATLPEIIGAQSATLENGSLDASSKEVLSSDAALFESVRARHFAQTQFDARMANLKTSLDQLIQEARAVAGVAHLEYVLELRRVDQGASPQKAVHGAARAQQEAAEQVVTAVLQLGQLMGKIGLTKGEDELNSVAANELSQNLSRAKSQLRALVANLSATDATLARAERMQTQFESVAAQTSAANDPQSLVQLRRSVLTEAVRAAELRSQTLESAKGLSTQLQSVERIVADETLDSSRSARRTLWVTRLLSLIAFGAALFVGLHAARRLRESVRGLRAQNRELENVSRDLKNMNEGLEGLVAERSAALALREHSMRLVLDAMSEGLVLAELSGKISSECSKAALSWFGRPSSSGMIWDYLLPTESEVNAAFRVGFAQIAEDFMPFEVSADCMPHRFEKGGRIFSLSYRQVFEDQRFERLLVVVNDITHQVESEARERDAREQHQLLAHMLKDKPGFLLFVRDAERLLGALREPPARDAALRTLHTLKGNTGVFGMESVASRCHELEEALSERSGSIGVGEAKQLGELFRARLSRIEGALTSEAQLELAEADLGELMLGLRQRRDYPELLDMVESWKWTRTSVMLRRLATQVHRVAERLGKHIDVRVEHNNLRVMPGALEDFWGSLIHVVRNAVDHGIESEAERVALGKPATGHVTLRTAELRGDGFSVELGDDGRGIDFTRLEAIAEQRGLPSRSRDELTEVMFADGVSTRDEASDVSGRGVGLGAVVAACRAAGGSVSVESVDGHGAWFCFSFPRQAVQVRQSKNSGTFHSVRPPRAAQSA
ncbi:MAG: ATP-binding protein [Polyangiaceae bacterium]